MVRLNETRKRTQRYKLAQKAQLLLNAGIDPQIDKAGNEFFAINGRHYILPSDRKFTTHP